LKLIRIAEAFLRQAGARLRDAQQALEEALNAYSLRLSRNA